MNKHQYYNDKFCKLSFLEFHGAVHMEDVEERDMKLAKSIFKEMAADQDITLSESSQSLIRQLDFLPSIGTSIKEPLLVMTIDYVLKEVSLATTKETL